MGSHSVTCHPAEVTFPPLPQPIKAGTRVSDPRGMQGWVDLVGLVTYQGGIPARRRSLIPVLTGLNVEQLRSCNERRYHSAKPPTVFSSVWYSLQEACWVFRPLQNCPLETVGERRWSGRIFQMTGVAMWKLCLLGSIAVLCMAWLPCCADQKLAQAETRTVDTQTCRKHARLVPRTQLKARKQF